MQYKFFSSIFSVLVLVFSILISGQSIHAQSGITHPDETGPVDLGSVGFNVATHHGAKLNSVAVYANYAYVSSGNAVHIFDLSAPNQLQPVRLFSLPFYVNKIVVHNDYLFVANGEENSLNFGNRGLLTILDLADPLHPQQISNTSTKDAYEMHVSDRYTHLLLTRETTLGNPRYALFDTSDVAAPRQTKQEHTFFSEDFVGINEYLVWLDEHYNGIEKQYDSALRAISIPDIPEFDDESFDFRDNSAMIYSLDGYGRAIGVANNHVYVLQEKGQNEGDFMRSGLISLDMANPLQPVETENVLFDMDHGIMAVSANRAYVSGSVRDEQPNQRVESFLLSFDLTNPGQPAQTGYLSIPSWHEEIAITSDGVLAKNWGNLYRYKEATLGSLSSSAVYSTSNLFDLLSAMAPLDEERWLVVNRNGLNVVENMDSMANPSIIGQASVVTGTAKIAVYNQHAYLVNRLVPHLPIYDLTEPTDPMHVGEIAIDSGNPAVTYTVETMTVNDTSAWIGYSAAENDPLFAIAFAAEYDLSNPASPVLMQSLSLGEFDAEADAGVHDIAFSPDGEHLYILTANRLHGYNILDSGAAEEEFTLDDSAIVNCLYSTSGIQKRVCPLAANESHLFVSQRKQVVVLDIAQPTMPKVVGSYEDAFLEDSNGNLIRGGLNAIDDILIENDTLILYDAGYVNASSVPRNTEWLQGAIQMVSIKEPARPTLFYEVQLPYSTSSCQFISYPGYELYCLTEVHQVNKRIYVADVSHIFGFDVASTISGRVIDAFGNPYPDLAIQNDGQAFVQTDEDGRFQFDVAGFETYKLSTAVSGFHIEPPELAIAAPNVIGDTNFYVLPQPISIVLTSDISTNPPMISYSDTQNLTTSFRFTSGMVDEETTVTISAAAHGGPTGQPVTGHAFEVEAHQNSTCNDNFAFPVPFTATIDYANETVNQFDDEADLMLWFFDGAQWIDAINTCQNLTPIRRSLDQNQIDVAICRTGLYVLAGLPLEYIHLPVILVP